MEAYHAAIDLSTLRGVDSVACRERDLLPVRDELAAGRDGVRARGDKAAVQEGDGRVVVKWERGDRLHTPIPNMSASNQTRVSVHTHRKDLEGDTGDRASLAEDERDTGRVRVREGGVVRGEGEGLRVVERATAEVGA